MRARVAMRSYKCPREAPGRELPAFLHSFILLVEPLLERSEVFEDSAGIAFALPGKGLHGVGPRLALSHFEHVVQLRAGCLRSKECAAVERAGVSRGAAHCTIELKFVNVGE